MISSFLLFSLLPLLLISSVSYRLSRNALEVSALSHLSDLARDAGRKISYYVDSRYQDLKGLSQADVFESGDLKKIQQFIREIIQSSSHYEAIFFLDGEGSIVACSNEAIIGDSRADRAWLKKTISGKQGDLVAIDVYSAESSEYDYVIGLNAPVTDDTNENTIGVLCVRINLYHILSRIRILDKRTVGGNHAYLLNRDAKIIAGPSREETLKSIFSLNSIDFRKTFIKKTGNFNFVDNHGEVLLAANYALRGAGDFAGWGWQILTVLPEEAVFSAAYRIRNYGIIAIVMIFFITILFSLYFSRRILNPLAIVAKTARMIANDHIEKEIVYNKNDEMGDLVTSFNHMIVNLNQQREKAELTQDVTIICKAVLTEYRAPGTGIQSKEAKNYVKILAQCLQNKPRFKHFLNYETIDLLYKSALLYDIGMGEVEETILAKAGKLTTEEFEQVEMHTLYGRDTLLNAEKQLGCNAFLTMAKDMACSHHEKWDGSGYPFALIGEDIPISGRIMALADVYDALTSQRVYRSALSHAEAVEIILQERGIHFDPDVVDAFIEVKDKFLE